MLPSAIRSQLSSVHIIFWIAVSLPSVQRSSGTNGLEQLQVINDIRPDGYLLRFNSLIFELLFQLYHNFSVKVFHQNINQRQKEMDRLDPVLNYIAEHYKEPISLDEIADIACLQTGYFCRFFKKKMGVTFLEYQNEYRLSFICRDLITTRDPVHVILERHGFTNINCFAGCFWSNSGIRRRRYGNREKKHKKPEA